MKKQKVAKLIEEGRTLREGFEMIEIAKQTGTWAALDEVENLTVPDDLKQLFSRDKSALNYWENFPRSSKRGIFEWIMNTKKPETHQKRMEETVILAGKNIKANHYRP